MARLILLDRDGVINVDSPDYIKNPAEWQPLPGALQAIVRLREAGCRVAVCTNQAGIGRGLFTLLDLQAIHGKMLEELQALGGDLDGLAFCPHQPADDCECRKPKPGMLLAMMQQLTSEPAATCFVGDSLKDVEAALSAGCEPILLRTGNGRDCELAARQLGVSRVYDDLAQFATAELGETRCC
jgi:D-glycero-D-manno-heptose 1,7-bisphosphate phosphatase